MLYTVYCSTHYKTVRLPMLTKICNSVRKKILKMTNGHLYSLFSDYTIGIQFNLEINIYTLISIDWRKVDVLELLEVIRKLNTMGAY